MREDTFKKSQIWRQHYLEGGLINRDGTSKKGQKLPLVTEVPELLKHKMKKGSISKIAFVRKMQAEEKS